MNIEVFVFSVTYILNKTTRHIPVKFHQLSSIKVKSQSKQSFSDLLNLCQVILSSECEHQVCVCVCDEAVSEWDHLPLSMISCLLQVNEIQPRHVLTDVSFKAP